MSATTKATRLSSALKRGSVRTLAAHARRLARLPMLNSKDCLSRSEREKCCRNSKKSGICFREPRTAFHTAAEPEYRFQSAPPRACLFWLPTPCSQRIACDAARPCVFHLCAIGWWGNFSHQRSGVSRIGYLLAQLYVCRTLAGVRNSGATCATIEYHRASRAPPRNRFVGDKQSMARRWNSLADACGHTTVLRVTVSDTIKKRAIIFVGAWR